VNYINLNNVRFRNNYASYYGDDIYTSDSNGFQYNSTSAVVDCVSTSSDSISLSGNYNRNVSNTTTSSNSNVFYWVCLKKNKARNKKDNQLSNIITHILFISDSRYE
jgi:hypothetical protein